MAVLSDSYTDMVEYSTDIHKLVQLFTGYVVRWREWKRLVLREHVLAHLSAVYNFFKRVDHVFSFCSQHNINI